MDLGRRRVVHHGQELEVAEPVAQHGQGAQLVAAEVRATRTPAGARAARWPPRRGHRRQSRPGRCQPPSARHARARRGRCHRRRSPWGHRCSIKVPPSRRRGSACYHRYSTAALLRSRPLVPSGLGPDGTASGTAGIRRPPHRSGRTGGPPCVRPGPGVVPRPAADLVALLGRIRRIAFDRHPLSWAGRLRDAPRA